MKYLLCPKVKLQVPPLRCGRDDKSGGECCTLAATEGDGQGHNINQPKPCGCTSIEVQPQERLLLFGANERECGSLRIDAKDDPQATRYLMGTHEHLAILLLDAR